MDSTLKQLLAEIYQCHREIEQLRGRVAELERERAELLRPKDSGPQEVTHER